MSDKEVKLTCEKCGYKTAGVRDMARHVKKIHGIEFGEEV